MNAANSAKQLLAYHEAQAQWCMCRARDAEAKRQTLTYRRMLSRAHQHSKWADVIKHLSTTTANPTL